MQALYYLVMAIVLYVVADRAVDFIEIRLGRRLHYRTILFFFILLGLGLIVFPLMRGLLGVEAPV